MKVQFRGKSYPSMKACRLAHLVFGNLEYAMKTLGLPFQLALEAQISKLTQAQLIELDSQGEVSVGEEVYTDATTACKFFGVAPCDLVQRLQLCSESVEEAINWLSQDGFYLWNQRYKSQNACCTHFRVKQAPILSRMKRKGETFEQAISHFLNTQPDKYYLRGNRVDNPSPQLQSVFRRAQTSRKTRKSKLLFGVGVNDSRHVDTVVNGKQTNCPLYQKWYNMLQRAYCPKWRLNKPHHPEYTVCKDWRNFSSFRTWLTAEIKKTDLPINDVAINIAILSEAKQYSPDTCVLLPTRLHRFINKCQPATNGLPTGISWYKRQNKYQANISINCKSKYLGRFDTIEEATDVYTKAKLKYVSHLPIPHWLDEKLVRRRLIEIVGRQTNV